MPLGLCVCFDDQIFLSTQNINHLNPLISSMRLPIWRLFCTTVSGLPEVRPVQHLVFLHVFSHTQNLPSLALYRMPLVHIFFQYIYTITHLEHARFISLKPMFFLPRDIAIRTPVLYQFQTPRLSYSVYIQRAEQRIVLLQTERRRERENCSKIFFYFNKSLTEEFF